MTAASPPPARRRTRTTASIVLLVLAVLLAPLTVVAGWARLQIEDTDRYVRTVTPLAEDPEVQQYVARLAADAIYEQLRLDDVVVANLPSDLEALGPAIGAAVRGFLNDAAARFTASDAFVRLWQQSNRLAHGVIKGVLTGDTSVTDLEDGQLTLDLGALLRELQQFLVDGGFELAGSIDLSGVDQRIVLAEGEQLRSIETARELVGALQGLSWVLFLATIATAAGSVLVASRRPPAVTRLGVGFAFAMVLVAVGLSIARQAFLGAIAQTLPRPVAAGFFDAVVDSMRAGFRMIFFLGLVLAALVVLVAQPSFARTWARPAQIAVGVIGLLAILARDAPNGSYVVFVLLGTGAAIGVLELIRRRRLAGPGVTVAPLTEAGA